MVPKGTGGADFHFRLRLFLEILKTYGLQPHNISPNSVLAIKNHVALCEGHLRLEALEENELGTLLRVPSTSNADPEAASEAEAPEASRPAKRKKPHLPAPVRNAPANQPPKAPKTLKKRTKPSPASFPITPEVEVPPKASSTSKPDPKDIINIDDLPEDPAHHGDSAKGTSSPIPPPDQPSSTFAGPLKRNRSKRLSSFK
ncbi:hypothetical protein QYE76_065198 [Lolium multiflorum]|uniref:Transposase (putative) gypsy type domain-containing protein n=1 Tax=Lolium multiflorum TaxID=4521 RepID=A0AAD8S968_LOLMU|nr:hypothetical protein QYE76_065198 [Lolium multiflorum]